MGSLCRQGRVVWSLWPGVWPVWPMEKVVSLSLLHFYHFQASGTTDTDWHMGHRLCSQLGRRPDQCEILWSKSRSSRPEICVQVPQTDDWWCGPCWLMCLLSILCTSRTFSTMPYPCLHVCMSAYSHPFARYNTFASAGSDGTISIWDHKVKKQCHQYPKYTGPIPSIAFNCNGTRFAVGVSYTWDKGEEGTKNAERPTVWVHRMGDEVKVSECAMGWVMHGTEIWCFEALTGLERQ